MRRQFVEILGSIAAGGVIAAMVATAGIALERPPTDAGASEANRPDPMVICTDDGERIYCFRAET